MGFKVLLILLSLMTPSPWMSSAWTTSTHLKTCRRMDPTKSVHLYYSSTKCYFHDGTQGDDDIIAPPFTSDRPLLAVLTDPDAISSVRRFDATLRTFRNLLRHGKTDLISVRCVTGEREGFWKMVELARRLVEMRTAIRGRRRFPMIVLNYSGTGETDPPGGGGDEYAILDALFRSGADGVHVKGRYWEDSPQRLEHLRKALDDFALAENRPIRLGTSLHSVPEGDNNDDDYLTRILVENTDYLFVGTCYATSSHPEKAAQDLEGPGLPGAVRRVLEECSSSQSQRRAVLPPIVPPKVFAIGGISTTNAWEPVSLGADGVAVIKSITKAWNPPEASHSLHRAMGRDGTYVVYPKKVVRVRIKY